MLLDHGFLYAISMLNEMITPRVQYVNHEFIGRTVTCNTQLIGSREHLQENPMIFMRKSGWFPVKIFPFCQPIDSRPENFSEVRALKSYHMICLSDSMVLDFLMHD